MDLLREHDPKDYEKVLHQHEIHDYRAVLQAMELLKKEKEAESGKTVRETVAEKSEGLFPTFFKPLC